MVRLRQVICVKLALLLILSPVSNARKHLIIDTDLFSDVE